MFLIGTLGFSVPALVAFLLTVPLVRVFGGYITWNRSALLALACTVLAVILSLSPVLVFGRALFPMLYAVAFGLAFGLRLLVLAAVADYRISRMVLPAFTQSAAAIAVGTWFFTPPGFVPYALLLQAVFGLVFIFLIWLIERPLKRAFQISGLNFLNTFIAHLTDGSKNMEDFFREIGEEVYVPPQISLFFSRDAGKDVLFTVPNVHPGPMGGTSAAGTSPGSSTIRSPRRRSSPTAAPPTISTWSRRARSRRSLAPLRRPVKGSPSPPSRAVPSGSNRARSRSSASGSGGTLS